MIVNYIMKPTNMKMFQKCSHLFQFNRFFLQNIKSCNSILMNGHNLEVFQIARNFLSDIYNHSICWKCGTKRRKLAELFCENCRVIQNPLEKENYFKLFQIQEQYSIDEKLLRDKFRNMQNLVHPDKFSNTTQEEQTISEEYSSLLNKAHSNLQSPLKRAKHLLKLKGQTITEGQTVDDPAFLMEVMTLNEEVEEAESDTEKMKKLNEKNKLEIKNILQKIDDNFKNNDIENAKKNIIILKYYTSISNRINGSLREQGVSD